MNGKSIMKGRMILLRGVVTLCCLSACLVAAAQAEMDRYVRHYSGYYLSEGSAGKAQLQRVDKTVKYHLKRSWRNYYNIIIENEAGDRYLTLTGDRELVFADDNSTANSDFLIEQGEGGYSLLKCRGNGKYVGTDDARLGSVVYCDKDGKSSKHLWYVAEVSETQPEAETVSYLLNPEALRQAHEGWGVSLCWWANMCGKWSDDKIDKIVDWLVSPTGLNYNVFRYNIGGGDDPQHRNCDADHMRSGKGQRAEMEGFKDATDGGYIWSRDAAQRKIMLKIKEKRPDAIFEAFSNSAPYYMTYSGCSAGNDNAGKDNLKPEYYEEFAHYLVDVCKHYKDEYGIEFRTLEPFNEPLTDYWGRNGGQEGCHFDYASQVAFLKVLYPILKASGLNTVISASDECWVSGAVGGFNAYRDGGVLDMVGQWNTHTYNADNRSRTQLNALVHGAGKRLWMSETGAGGDGIKGNLDMVHRLFDDVRYLECESWHDWQYIEEWNDQWCMVKASFANQSYERVKNYYVRQQVTRFIKPGYRFVATSDDLTLAAVSEQRDTLVLVAINPGRVRVRHECRLMNCEPTAAPSVYMTTATGSMVKTSCEYAGGVLSITMPDLSIATFIIPMKKPQQETVEIRDGAHYMIQPQYNREVALTAADGAVKVDDVAYPDGWKANAAGEAMSPIAANQTWQLHAEGNGSYMLENMEGDRLYGNIGYYLGATADDLAADANGYFNFTRIDNHSYKITLAGENRALDLENGKSDAGTTVGVWEYGSDASQAHRHWQLIPLQLSADPASVDAVTQAPVKLVTGRNMLTVTAPSESRCNVAVYALNGVCKGNVDFTESVAVPLASGYYVVRVSCDGSVTTRTVKVQ